MKSFFNQFKYQQIHLLAKGFYMDSLLMCPILVDIPLADTVMEVIGLMTSNFTFPTHFRHLFSIFDTLKTVKIFP